MLMLMLLAMTLAIANVIDTFTDIVAVSVGGISAVYLGLLNALSYVAYILGLFIGGKLADNGKIKIQIFMSLAGFSIYGILLAEYTSARGMIILILMYISYSIVQAFARTSVNAYIHEFYPSIQWRKLLVQRAVMTVISEALLLLTISTGVTFILSNLYIFVLLLSVPIVLTYFTISDPSFKIERTLYRLEVGLRRIENVITDNLVVYTLLTNNNGSLFKRANLRTLFTKTKYISARRVLASLICFRFANAILLIQLPVYLGKYLGFSSGGMLLIYGLARLLLIMDLIVPFEAGVKTFLLMIMRGLIPFLLVVQEFKAVSIWISLILGLIIYLNNKIDVTLYSMYIESIGRAESTRYLVTGELTVFIATTISGIIYSLISIEGVVSMSAVVLFIGALLVRI